MESKIFFVLALAIVGAVAEDLAAESSKVEENRAKKDVVAATGYPGYSAAYPYNAAYSGYYGAGYTGAGYAGSAYPYTASYPYSGAAAYPYTAGYPYSGAHAYPASAAYSGYGAYPYSAGYAGYVAPAAYSGAYPAAYSGAYAAKSYVGASPYYGSYGYDDGQYYPGKYPGTGYPGYKAAYTGYPAHHY